METEHLFEVALGMVPNIGAVQARILSGYFQNARDIFYANEFHLKKIEGIGEKRARSIKRFKNFEAAEKEIRFTEQNHVKILYLTNPHYPQRLLHCFDPPTLLYYKGEANLNASRMISVIGTRGNTAYGKQMTERLVADLLALSEQKISIISGLAYGIDAIAHQSAIEHRMPTIGVLGHGINRIYPPQHKAMVGEMLRNGGGILTEFSSETLPDKHNFPVRNRIVAGMSDATVVVETGVRGGSIITAELANGYNKDVFAIPGRTTDEKSAGCNYLILKNKAILLNDADELLDHLNWKDERRPIVNQQRKIFVELSPDERTLIQLLGEKEEMHIDELRVRSGLSSSLVARAILNLEMQQVIVARPGKLYSIL